MGTLFVVATPIGNLQDITFRAVEILKTVDLIAAEDTRQTKKLLNHYDIGTPLISLHQHSAPAKIAGLVDRLIKGESIAVVSDAGTPGIADPGQPLVAAARQSGISIVPIPGPSSVTTLLSVAGVPTDSFMFVGFLPKKKGRASLWQEIAGLSVPVVLFESPNRIVKTLQEITLHLGDRPVVVGRELTKLHEEIRHGSASNLAEYYSHQSAKGEFVLVIT